MNQPINGGGSAFPHTTQWDGITPAINHNGMTIRDYFAAQAMQAIISSVLSEKTKTQYNINKPDFMECLSLDAYAHADAMIKVREAK